MVDISLNSTTMDVLTNMIGKRFESFSSDPFIFAPDVFGIVGLRIDDKAFKMTIDLEAVKRFYHKDDVAVLRIAECPSSEIVSRMDNGQMIITPVEDTIVKICIINDHETVIHGNNKPSLGSTKGIIFHLASGNEISFEVGTWFSEMITIRRGYDLINSFTPIEEFYEEWEDCEGYTPSCSREVITIF